MTFRLQPVAAAVSALMFGAGLPVFAQTAPAAPAGATQEVEITGIRASLQRSIATKREADTNIEVVSAEDVGKLPDRNIADALSRLSGVNITHGSALAFDEAERIQIRGTPPGLNMFTINGHSLSSGDWFLGDQNATSRSVSFALLPSQLVGRAIVYKNGRADITEGGISGSIDVQTRRPLDMRKPFAAELSLGAVHTTLAGKTSPQVGALFNFVNEDRSFGLLVQAFSESRKLRRDGIENFGATTLLTQATTDPARCVTVGTSPVCGNAELRGKRIVGVTATAFFEGERERTGGFVSAQWRPVKGLDIGLSAFSSRLKAQNYNSNTYATIGNQLNNNAILSNYTISDDVVVAGTVNPSSAAPTAHSVQADHNVRDGAGSTSRFVDLDFSYQATPRLKFDARIGQTKGTGETKAQPSAFFRSYQRTINFNTQGGLSWNVPGVNLSSYATDWQLIEATGGVFATRDQDTYAHLNGTFDLDAGIFTRTRFGLRAADHKNEKDQFNGAWNFRTTGTGSATLAEIRTQFPTPASWPLGGIGSYPSDYASGLQGSFPKNQARLDQDTVIAFGRTNVNYDKVLNKSWPGSYVVKEQTRAVYAMQDFELNEKISGNFGLRWVSTEVNSNFYQTLTSGREGCAALAVNCTPSAPRPGAITSSRYGVYFEQDVTTTHNVALPSVNLRWNLDRGLIARASVSETLARPEYRQLAAATSLNNNSRTGSSGNPYLKPAVSTNWDASLAWFASPRSYIQGGVFEQRIDGYIKSGTSVLRLLNSETGLEDDYQVTAFTGQKAKLRGLELSGETPIGAGFGVIANLTAISGKDADGATLLNMSKQTLNLRAYYESGPWTLSLAGNQRSKFAIGNVGNGVLTQPSTTAGRAGQNMADAQKSLAASVSYKFSDTLSLSVEGTNLTNPTYYYYSITPDLPLGWYKNGRQVYATLRAKF